jgi:2-dehydro-3-deoxygluconokinase
VTVGTLNVDVIVAGEAPREMEELIKWVAPSQVELAAAGSVGYCAIDMARLGLKVAMLSSVADDALGRLVLKALNDEGIDTRAVKVEKGQSSGIGIYLLLFGSRKRPLTGRLATHAPWPARLSRLGEERLNSARLLHCGGYLHYENMWGEPSERLFRKAKQLGLITSLDTQFPFAPVKGSWMKCFGRLLDYVDVIFTDEIESSSITGRRDPEAAARELLKAGPRLAVVKMGAQGALLADHDRVVHQKAFPVDEICDTIGAGDAFDAGVLYGLLSGWPLDKTARFAAAASALTLKGMGGVRTAPNPAQVRRFLGRLKNPC